MAEHVSFDDLIQHTRYCSPFSGRLLDADPALNEQLQAEFDKPWTPTEIRENLHATAISDESSLKTVLRKLRKRVMLRLIARDLNGLADLQEVVETCTVLAEETVDFALGYLSKWQAEVYGEPFGETGEVQPLIVIGMGKLGGRELNVSSDIDLIFAYPEDGETRGPRQISNHEYFSRLGKRLIAVIGEATSDGFVFRVDMRLRPYGDSGPLVGSFAMLEEYYQTQGREWERYAWIKGRVIAGPEAELQNLLRPFVFRKYLDYGAFASMRDLKVQIQREVNRREMHDNIKLGPGGIREIEFIAQVFQLIRGGRERELQIRPTCPVLALLASRGLLPTDTVRELTEAYTFLRNLEHRIQYLQDAQTQMLPADDENRARLAAAMGFDDWPGLEQVLNGHREKVEHHFGRVFEAEKSAEANTDAHQHLKRLWLGDVAAEVAVVELGALGYQNPGEVQQRLAALQQSTRYQQLPQQSRERFDALMPALIGIAASVPLPDETLVRALNLFEAICRRANYLALLTEYPQALELVCRICSASPWLANYLTQHPILLDELLDTRNLYAEPDFAKLADTLESALVDCGDDVERKLDVLRHFKHAQTFRIAARDVAGQLALEKLSDELSALADLILGAVLRHAWTGLRNRHREQPEFAVIGYGKLGGKELGYSSDLDIVFLYQDETPEAAETYARFGQRINSWLNSITSAGQLYETDLRLRPDGASGLLVSSVDAFLQYQREKAWTWEHQALTRARFCAGTPSVGAEFERIRLEILCTERDVRRLREDVMAMRQKMHDGHPNNTEMFDIKHDRGGIVDVEFMVQFLVLSHSCRLPGMADDVGNIALLRQAAVLNLIPMDQAEKVAQAYREYRREQHRLRLQGIEKMRVPPADWSVQRASVTHLWNEIFQP